MQDISNATTSFQLMVYQVTDPVLCTALLDLHKHKVEVTLLVSSCIDSYTDTMAAEQCYANLTAAGFGTIYKTPSCLTCATLASLTGAQITRTRTKSSGS